MFRLKSPIYLLRVLLLMVSCGPGQNKGQAETRALDDKARLAPWAYNAVIYEVNLRQYTPEGTFEAFSNHLPRLKDLGVDILWLMPIHPIGEENRKGTLGSYYSIRDYKGVNPEYGTIDDFRALVTKAHELGLKVIIDWVANHSSWDNAWVFEHPDWYAKDSLGNMYAPFDWTDVVQFDYSNQGLRDAMKEAMIYWVREADIDGFRCDVAGMVPVDFWESAREALDSIKPVFMLAEDEDVSALLEKAFNSNYGWSFHHHMNKIAQGSEKVSDLMTWFANYSTKVPEGAFQMHFTSNHDENSWNGTAFERMGKAYKTMAVLTFTVEGMPLIYSGQEAGLNRRLEFFEKDQIDWSDLSMSTFYKELIRLKKENEALWNGNHGGKIELIATDRPEEVLMFTRRSGSNQVVAVFNLSGNEVEVSAETTISGQYPDFFTGNIVSLPLKGFSLNPWEYRIISIQE